jgi:hypothetical protein
MAILRAHSPVPMTTLRAHEPTHLFQCLWPWQLVSGKIRAATIRPTDHEDTHWRLAVEKLAHKMPQPRHVPDDLARALQAVVYILYHMEKVATTSQSKAGTVWIDNTVCTGCTGCTWLHLEPTHLLYTGHWLHLEPTHLLYYTGCTLSPRTYCTTLAALIGAHAPTVLYTGCTKSR